jgi:hypothetical protein
MNFFNVSARNVLDIYGDILLFINVQHFPH